MKIVTQISEKEYLKLMMEIFYKKPFFIIFNIIGAVLIFCYILNWNLEGLPYTPIYYLFFALFFVAINPLIYYLAMKKQISANSELTEKINYEFTKTGFCMEGTTFKTEIPIADIYRIKENQEWIFIYLDKKTINFIPKSALGNQFEEFKNLYTEKFQ